MSEVATFYMCSKQNRRFQPKRFEKWDQKINSTHWFDWKKENIIKHVKLFSMKMDEEILTFVDVKNEKSKFYSCKSTAVLKDVDI